MGASQNVLLGGFQKFVGAQLTGPLWCGSIWCLPKACKEAQKHSQTQYEQHVIQHSVAAGAGGWKTLTRDRRPVGNSRWTMGSQGSKLRLRTWQCAAKCGPRGQKTASGGFSAKSFELEPLLRGSRKRVKQKKIKKIVGRKALQGHMD